MSTLAPSATDLVEEILLKWQEAREQGRPCSAEELCAAHPDLLPEVRSRLGALQAMLGLLQLGQTTLPDPGGETPSQKATPGDLPDVPGYELLGLIDEGGMGTVYRARQPGLSREVAIKMVRVGRLARADQLARFRAEAEAVARLRHQNIIQIYEVGEWAGQPYFSMEYVPGGNLAQRLTRGLIPVRETAGLVRALAEAVQHAHSCGVVHRDLKPANVLLRLAGPSEFEPLVGDFGLAKFLNEEGPTRTGAVLGTPQYLAPEQAEGRKDVGPLTDIHALGAILYELLAGRPPFLGASTVEVLDQVRSADPRPPSRVQPGVPWELEVICLKCLEKEPCKRYASAGELADDLGRYLRGEPIRARPTPVWRRAVKLARRQPLLTGLVAVSVVALLALLAVWGSFTYQLQAAARQLKTERDEANRQHVLADESRKKAEAEKGRAEVLLGHCMAAIDAHAEATEASRHWKETTGELGSIPFVVARVYAASARVYREDRALAEEDRERFAERYARRAVELLDKARLHRYFERAENRARLLKDPDLEPLRGRTDFRELLARVGVKEDGGTTSPTDFRGKGP